jgi:hypothetical protein
MGTWGTSIESNDNFADFYDEFFVLYNSGLESKDISNRLINKHQEDINDPYYCNDFWFALAKAQWECKQLDNEVLNRVKDIIESGSDLIIWKEQGASPENLDKRQIELEKFLIKLQDEKKNAKKRVGKSICPPFFSKGDCLAFKLFDGNYGGAVVVEAIDNDEFGHNLIAATRINQKNKPTIKSFKKAEVLVTKYHREDYKEHAIWFIAKSFKSISNPFEKIGNIQVNRQFNHGQRYNLIAASWDNWIVEAINKQFQSELTKIAPSIKLTIKELTRKKKKWGLF